MRVCVCVCVRNPATGIGAGQGSWVVKRPLVCLLMQKGGPYGERGVAHKLFPVTSLDRRSSWPWSGQLCTLPPARYDSPLESEAHGTPGPLFPYRAMRPAERAWSVTPLAPDRVHVLGQGSLPATGSDLRRQPSRASGG